MRHLRETYKALVINPVNSNIKQIVYAVYLGNYKLPAYTEVVKVNVDGKGVVCATFGHYRLEN